jgi:anaerobic glycerol-3-phosphate dehydrogenase
MERWDISSGPSYIYPPVGQPYDIPPGALQSEAIENLLAAGTCISATTAAAASTRASGICLATGYAAGRLALSRVAK